MPEVGVAPYPWQQAAWTGCVESARNEKLGHALLLTAPPGTGLLSFVRAFCAHLLDLELSGEAPEDRAYPDLHWLRKEEPDSWNKLTKPRTQILVGQIRELANYLAQKPTGPLKVAVIEDAHSCSESSANALLKPLEEPAKHSHILLMSEMPGQILATVRSRCTHIKVGSPVASEAAEWLAEFDDLAARLALWMTGGAPIAARELIEEGTVKTLMELDKVLAQWLATSGASGSSRDWSLLQQFTKQDAMLVNQLLLRAILAAGIGDAAPGAPAMPQVQTVAVLGRMSKADLVSLLDDCINKRRAIQQLPVLNHELLLLNQFQRWLEPPLAQSA